MKRGRIIFLVILGVIFIIVAAGIVGSEYYTSQPEFCGSCHIMKKPFDSWARSKHKAVKCVECHYAPGESSDLKAKFKGLGQLFTYFATKEREVRKPTKINDISCMTSKCHPKQKLNDNKFKFKEKVFYIHKTHFEKTIEGQSLHCQTCHQHVSVDKHFEVPKEACFLCHFKNADFNKGRSKCSLCHEIPTKSLQKQKEEAKPDEKPVTHQSLEEAKVPCQSCHYELIRGKGEIKEEECLDCHDAPEALENKNDKKLMHEQHVAGQNAKCFDCHKPIQHKKIDFLDPVRESCFICHPDHHTYQKLLLVGDKRKDVMKTPGLMHNVKTNCIGCHKDERDIKGEKVLYGSAKTCVACHTEKHEGMIKEWKDKIKDELNSAKEIEKEALEAVEKAKGKITEEKLKKAIAMIKEGQEDMQIVEYGGGVHNQKYSIQLLDIAMNNFEDAIDLLKE